MSLNTIKLLDKHAVAFDLQVGPFLNAIVYCSASLAARALSLYFWSDDTLAIQTRSRLESLSKKARSKPASFYLKTIPFNLLFID